MTVGFLGRIAPGAVTLSAVVLAMGASPSSGSPTGNPQVEISIENRGKIVLEMLPREAPKTAAHFVELVKAGFYNGVLFHRVVPNFVAQAGDPGSKKLTPAEIASRDDHQGGTSGLGAGGSKAGGASANIPFEENELTNERGAVAMALSGPRSATGDSQFFINLKPNHALDGDYCVFARVSKGMDVVDKVKRGDKIVTATVVPVRSAR